MFSMLRCRVEVQLNVGPHQGARMGVPTCLNFLDVTLRTSWLSALTMYLRRKAREHVNTVRTHISHLTAHMCASVLCGRMWQIRQAMTEKSAKCEALQRVHDCRSHGCRAARSTVHRPAQATPLPRRSSSSLAPTRKHKRLRPVILNLERLEPYCGAFFLRCVKILVACLTLSGADRSATNSRGEAAFVRAAQHAVMYTKATHGFILFKK